MWHVDKVQTNLYPYSYESSCSTAHSFHTEMSRTGNFHWVSFILLTAWAQGCKGSTKQAGSRTKQQAGQRAILSAAMHVWNYFKNAHKDFKISISIQIFKTLVSSLKDHFQLAIQILHSTVLQ